MLTTRQFRIRTVSGQTKTIRYTGEKQTVKL